MLNNKKDIGISWVGDIPNGWSTKRIKDITVNLGGGNYGEDEGNEGVILPCISISDFKNGNLSNASNIKMNRVYKKKNILKQGSILIEKSGGGEKVPVGRTIYLLNDLESYYTNFVQGIKIIGNNSKFVNYCFQVIHKNKLHMDSVKQTTGLQNFEFNKFSNYFQIPVPPLETQNKIASYLDTETSKIDRKISILEQKHEKLEEYKQSVIFETVTKGLDNNVPMKDSGVEWIGDIPAHWEVKRVKECLKLKSGDLIDKSKELGKYSIFGANGVIGSTNKLNIKDNTLLIGRVGSAGAVNLVHRGFASDNSLIVIISKNQVTKYYYYYFKIFNFEDIISKTSHPLLVSSKLLRSFIATPDVTEQNKIVGFLDTFTSKIDKKKEIIKKQIDLLKEYKQTIIYEVVTGKMEIL